MDNVIEIKYCPYGNENDENKSDYILVPHGFLHFTFNFSYQEEDFDQYDEYNEENGYGEKKFRLNPYKNSDYLVSEELWGKLKECLILPSHSIIISGFKPPEWKFEIEIIK
jgi:hypothetical protein